MATVAAVIDQGALTFDFAIPCEVFGLDRSDIVDPWYEFLVVAAGDRRVRTQTGFVIEAPHGLGALERADTVVVPGWSDPDHEPSDALKRGAQRGARARRTGRRRSARARSCSPPPACSTAGARRRTGCTRSDSAPLPAGRRRAGRAVHRGRQRLHVRRDGRRHRPLHAPRRARPRRGRGRDSRPAARDAAVPRGRPGAVRRPADRARPGRRAQRAARLGAGRTSATAFRSTTWRRTAR